MSHGVFVALFLIQILVGSIVADEPMTRNLGKRCHIEEYPFMVSFTRTIKMEALSRQYNSYHGVLLTLRWVVTTKIVLDMLVANKISLVIAGCDQRFYADYVEQYRIVTHLYSYKHKLAEKEDMYSVGVAALNKPFEETAAIKAVKLPPNKSFTEKCTKATLVRFISSESDDEFTDNMLYYNTVKIDDRYCYSVKELRE